MMQQNQEMMRLSQEMMRLSQATTAVQLMQPPTTTAAPVVVTPHDVGGREVGGGEVEEGSPLARSASQTVLPPSLAVLAFSVKEDGLRGSDNGLKVKALDAVFY
jgi:hypothetical protein